MSNERVDADSAIEIAAALQHYIKYQDCYSLASNIKAAIVLTENVLWAEAACLDFEARGTDLVRQQQGGPRI